MTTTETPANEERRSLWRRARPYFIGFLAGVLLLVGYNAVRAIRQVDTSLEPGEISLISGVDSSRTSGNAGVRQTLIDRWNTAHPRNHVRIVELSEAADLQHSEMVARAQRHDEAVDIYNLDVTWTAEFASAGYIQPFGTTDTSGFLGKPLATCMYEGRLWALPFNTDAALLYYRKDVFGPDGERVPAHLPPTRDDLEDVAAKKPDTVKAWYVTQLAKYEGMTVNGLEAIWAGGGDVVSDKGQVILDPEKAEDTLKVYADALKGDSPQLLAPESLKYHEHESADAFAQGSVALMRNWPVWYSTMKADKATKVDFGVKPLHDGVLGGQNLAIATGTTKPKAAKALIEYLTSGDSQRWLFGDGGFPATRIDTYDDPSVRSDRPYATALRDAVQAARLRPQTTHYALFSATFQDVIDAALRNGGTLPPDAPRRLTIALAGRLA
jgi:multiple sugar transport system substrate-binding protein